VTVGELRAAIASLPDDMEVMSPQSHPTDGLVAAVVRMHFSSPRDHITYVDVLMIQWSGVHWEFKINERHEVVNQHSGYRPTLQSVLHEDKPQWPPHRWKLTTEPGNAP
jgi:hypothetical protein